MQPDSPMVLRISGRDWPPGARVFVGLKMPGPEPAEAEVGTSLVDASGGFVAIVQVPSHAGWAQTPEFSVVVRTKDSQHLAQHTFAQDPLIAPTPTTLVVPSATMPATGYVLGYVQNVVLEARTIKIIPIEGVADTIVLGDEVVVEREGQQVDVAEIGIGDLLEITGRLIPGDASRLVAELVRVLVPQTPAPTAEATPEPTTTLPTVLWIGEYYGNTTFSGQPTVTRDDAVIDFQWQAGSPADGVPADNFGVRWSGTWPFERGMYRLHAQVDDGVRVWVDGHLIIDQWYQSLGALYEADAYLSAGLHAVRVEYFDAQGDAYARMWWDYRGPEPTQAFPDWRGEYYDNMELEGLPSLIIGERRIDFDWGHGAPAMGLSEDGFSARWTQAVTMVEGLYRFYALSDDGLRLWVDEVPVIDEWHDHAASTVEADVPLEAGPHNIRVEYYENTGNAAVRVWWELVPTTPTPSATPVLQPTHTPEPTLTEVPDSTSTPTPTVQATPTTPQPEPDVTPMSPQGVPFRVYFPGVGAPAPAEPSAHRLPDADRASVLVRWSSHSGPILPPSPSAQRVDGWRDVLRRWQRHLTWLWAKGILLPPDDK